MSVEPESVHLTAVMPSRADSLRIQSSRDRQRDTLVRWGLALEHGDTVEVARLVSQSHNARVEDAEIGRIGPMVGTAETNVPDGGVR